MRDARLNEERDAPLILRRPRIPARFKGIDAPQVLLRAWRPSVLTILVALLVLQFVIPARFVIGGLGAVGRPSVAVGILLLYLWFISALRRDSLPARRQPIRWAVGAYLFVTIAGYAVGLDRGLPMAEASGSQRWLIYTAAMVGLALAVSDGVATRIELDILLKVLVVLTSFMALVGMLQHFEIIDLTRYIQLPGLQTNSDLIGIGARGDGDFSRVAGTASHYIEFGVVLALVMPLALHYAIFCAKGAARVAHWGAVAVIAASIPFSISRAAILTLVIAMGMMFLVWPWRTRYNMAAISMVAVAVFHVMNRGVLGTIKALFVHLDDDPSIQGRIDDTEFVWRTFAERPWLGRGPGTVLPDSYRLLDNQIYGTLLAGGVVGLAAFGAVLLVPYLMSRSIRLRGLDQETRHLGQAFAAVFPAALLASGTFDSLSFPTFTGVMFLVVGAVGALWRLAPGDPRHAMVVAEPGDKWVATPIMADFRRRFTSAVAATGRGAGVRQILGLSSLGGANRERRQKIRSE